MTFQNREWSPTCWGRVNQEAERIAEAVKIHCRDKKFEWLPNLTRDANENIILLLLEKFLGGPKNNQLLNPTLD